MVFPFSFQCWGGNPDPCAWQASAPSLSHIPSFNIKFNGSIIFHESTIISLTNNPFSDSSMVSYSSTDSIVMNVLTAECCCLHNYFTKFLKGFTKFLLDEIAALIHAIKHTSVQRFLISSGESGKEAFLFNSKSYPSAT